MGAEGSFSGRSQDPLDPRVQAALRDIVRKLEEMLEDTEFLPPEPEHPHPPELAICPDCDKGQWILTTASGSHYLVDLDADVVLRVPDPDRSTPEAPLRRDTEEIPLLWMNQIRVGHPAVFYLDLRQDGVTTERVTSAVVGVRRAAAQPD